MDGWVCNYVDRIPRNVIYDQSERVVFFSTFEKKSRYCCGPRTHRLPSPRIYVREAYCIRTVLAQPRIYRPPFPRFNSLHSNLTRSPDLRKLHLLEILPLSSRTVYPSSSIYHLYLPSIISLSSPITMPSYKSFTATIHDTTTLLPLREYMTSHNPLTNTCQTYIEPSHNQPFTIILKDEESVFAQGTAVFVDGVYVDNGLTGPGIAVERRWYGKRVDHVFVKPFVFRENLSGKKSLFL